MRHDLESKSVVDSRWVDSVCDQFENAWRKGQPLSIESLIDTSPAHLRSTISFELNSLVEELQRERVDGQRSRHSVSGNESSNEREHEQEREFVAIDRYTIVGELGRGGIGIVYEAWDPKLKRKLAIKRLRAGFDASPEELKSMRSEAEAIAKIRHPNIVQIYDVGELNGMPFLAMEFCEGGSLAKRIDGQPLQPTLAAEFILKIAAGVGEAHKSRIIHRDLKPGNVLLERAGLWNPKVADFGLAKLLDGDGAATVSGSIIGTPAYMAPEQAFGDSKRVGPAADIYSIGAILYECLTGRPPFRGTTVADTLDQVRSREPVAVRLLEPKVPIDLQTITHKCLRKDSSQRYASVEELAEDLTRFLEHKPIRARRESWIESSWRMAIRYPLVASLTSAFLLFLLTVAVGSLMFAKHANKLKNEALLAQADALVGHAHGTRLNRHAGQRFEALRLIRKAAAIGNRLKQPADWFEPLRDEAIAALLLPDLYVDQFRDEGQPLEHADFSDNHQLCALSFASGDTEIRRLSDQSVIARLPRIDNLVGLTFVGNDRLLQSGDLLTMALWDVGKSPPQKILDFKGGWPNVSHGGRLIAVNDTKTISVIQVDDGSVVGRLDAAPISREPNGVPHPTHPYVLLHSYHHPSVELRNWETGEVLRRFEPDIDDSGFMGADWSPDGQRLVLMSGHGQALYWFRFSPETAEWTLERTQRPAPDGGGGGARVNFNQLGDRLLVKGWSDRVGLIDANHGISLQTADRAFSSFADPSRTDPLGTIAGFFRSPDQETKYGMMSIAEGRESSYIIPMTVDIPSLPAFDPSGRFVVANVGDRFLIADAATCRIVFEKRWLGLDIWSYCFDEANHICVNAHQGIFRLPYRFVDERETQIELGVPEPIHMPFGKDGRITTSPDGQTIAGGYPNAFDTQQYYGCWIKAAGEPAGRKMLGHAHGDRCAISADGNLITSSTGGATTIYKQSDGLVPFKTLERVVLQNNSRYADFTRDGELLFANDRLWRTRDWTSVPVATGKPQKLSADGRQYVSYLKSGTACLSDVPTGKVFARFEGLDCELSPRGDRLLLRNAQGFWRCDMPAIRKGVLELGLPWDGPDYKGINAPEAIQKVSVVPDLERTQSASELFALIDRTTLEKAKSEPHNGQAAFSAAMVLTKRGDYGAALEEFNRTCELLPKAITPRQWRAYTLAAIGNWQVAITDADWVLAKIDEPDFRLLRAEWLIHNGQYDRAIQDCNKLAQEFSAFAHRAAGLRVFAFVGLGDLVAAEKEKMAFLGRLRADAKSLNNAASALIGDDISLRRPLLAQLYVEKLLTLETNLSSDIPVTYVRDTVGFAYYRNQRYLEALEPFKDNLSDESNVCHLFALCGFAMCYAKLDDWANANEFLERARKWTSSKPMPAQLENDVQRLLTEASAVVDKATANNRTNKSNSE